MDGSLAKVDRKSMQVIEEVNLDNTGVRAVTSSEGKIYALSGKGLLHHCVADDPISTTSVFMSSSCRPIGDIIFPAGFSEVFATRCHDEISIWNVTDQRELLKIQLGCQQNMAGVKNSQTTGVGADPSISIPLVNCMDFMPDGKSIVSGWSDGHIRAFLPQSGKLFYLIKDAHK